jgi:hypothetical protein
VTAGPESTPGGGDTKSQPKKESVDAVILTEE